MDFKNFDLGKMDPAQMRAMMNLFNSMPESQLQGIMKSMGIDMDPAQIKVFLETIKNASDADLNNLKEQYKSGKINMKDFKPENPVFTSLNSKLEEAKKLMNENKLSESCDLCYKILEEAKKDTEEKDKEQIKKYIEKIYEQLTLSRYTLQDYDTCIKECTTAIEEAPLFSVINRMGICYFKKGRHVKARDAFNKAKQMFPNETDTIADKYLKMALEEIENY